MLHNVFTRRTFEGEKQQLQELNSRLGQYLTRTRQLELENAHLMAEISKLRQAKTTEWEPGYRAELRELRRLVERMSLEKSQAEMEREKLWRELQAVQSLCGEQTAVCRDISGELHGCEKELHHAHRSNAELQQHLLQLQGECKRLEDAHRQEMERLRRQAASRMAPVVTQTHRGPPAASLEEVQACARGLSEGWVETLEMYQHKVDEMERSIEADRARLGDLQREKMLYAAELDKLRTDAEKQGHVQMRLEEQLMHMQDQFHADASQYQAVIEQLERERNGMVRTIEEKMLEHQQLLRVKMDLGMEVAAYRALLEGERVGLHDTQMRANQHQRERIIDIKIPAQRYTPRPSASVRQHTDIRFKPSTSNLRSIPVSHSGSRSPSRVIPISVTGRAQHQSPASRRDMVSFSKARAAATAAGASAAAPDSTKDKQMSQAMQKMTTEEKTVQIKQVSQAERQSSPVKSSAGETHSIKVVSPQMMSLSTTTETERKMKVPDEKENGVVCDSEFRDKGKVESVLGPSEKKVLESVSVQEIIEKVMKPAGLEAKACSSGESKVTYHVEKTEQEDGSTKTQIVLQSKVEEELDISEDSALEELLSQGVKKVLLEDIKNTATGSMIQNLLSGLQGDGDLQNKSVNVEIIEEPVEAQSDEEYEVEKKSEPDYYKPTSTTYFQIEELENVPHDAHVLRSDDDTIKTLTKEAAHSKGGSVQVQVQEVFRESESPYFSHDQDPNEYFVSTPDDNLSEAEDLGGITSYGHYGVVDDLSDERYYQDERLPTSRVIVEESDEYKFMPGDRSFAKESFPECIIEEEVRVSPIVQESMLEFLREDSMEPKDQLKGALEKLHESVSGPLKEELAFLTKVSRESPEKMTVDMKKVQQSSDNGTMTIVAELNVTQSLEDSGLLEGDDLSNEQIMAPLRSSNLEKAIQGGAGGGYSIKVSREEVVLDDDFDGLTSDGGSLSQVTEKHIKLGPSEKSFTFQMKGNSSHAEVTSEQELSSQILEVSQEKKVATVYLESPTHD